MSVFYPEGLMTLRVFLENFGDEQSENLNGLYVFTVVCRNLNVNINSYRDADTFDATIDFKSFPFDPRTIRSAGVTIHIADRKKLYNEDGSLNHMEPSEENTVFQGFVDEDSIDLNDDDRLVKLKGRDFTSLLLDREYTGKPIQLTKPLDQVFRDLLDELPEAKLNGENGIKINNKTGATLPVIANFAPSKEKNSVVKNARKNRSYWDQIQEITQQAGLIAYISLDELVITKPRTLYDRSKSKIFVYGENLSSLNFERKLGRQKNFNLRVLSYNVEKKQTIEALIPEQGTAAWGKDIGINRKRIQVPTINTKGEKGEPKDAPFITFRLRDISNFNQLVSVGEGIFEEIGRQQIEGKLTTQDMTMVDRENNVFDATKFRVGTPIEVAIDQGDMEGLPKITESGSNIDRKRVESFLLKRNFEPNIASAMAESLTRFDTPFFTKAINFKLDQESGWSMELQFINFIDLPKSLVT